MNVTQAEGELAQLWGAKEDQDAAQGNAGGIVDTHVRENAG